MKLKVFSDRASLIDYNNVVVILGEQWRCIESLIENNFLRRFAQIRERGVWARVHQEYVTSQESEEEPTIIDVSMVTVAPILVVLAAGYILGIFVLLIERFVHGNTLKCWPLRSVRIWRQNEY